MNPFARSFQQDAPWVWLHAGALSITLLIMLSLLGFIGYQSFHHFWPKPVLEFPLKAATTSLLVDSELWDQPLLHSKSEHSVNRHSYLENAVIWGQPLISQELPRMQANALGHPLGARKILLFLGDALVGNSLNKTSFVKEHNSVKKQNLVKERNPVDSMPSHLWVGHVVMEKQAEPKSRVALIALYNGKKLLHQPMLWLDHQGKALPQQLTENVLGSIQQLPSQLIPPDNAGYLITEDAFANIYQLPIADIAWGYYPNRLSVTDSFGVFIRAIRRFILGSKDRQLTQASANNTSELIKNNVSQHSSYKATDAVMPAIMGTVLMVFLMTLIVTPFGLCAALYLHEYAPKNHITRILRVFISNMAAVPSVVYGVFGLGFFMQTLGGAMDQLLENTSSTWQTPGLLWMSLTLALMTLPTVIITAEEGLARIPKRLREASLALGATQAETLVKVVLPLTLPAMMTGVILAIARAAGEVAPLILVGVANLTSDFPVTASFPFVHLDQPVMHLGYHIYETTLFDPKGAITRTWVYSMAALLIIVILGLNLFAIRTRQRLRERYRTIDV